MLRCALAPRRYLLKKPASIRRLPNGSDASASSRQPGQESSERNPALVVGIFGDHLAIADQRVSLADPEIAEAILSARRKVLVNGKKPERIASAWTKPDQTSGLKYP